MPIPNQDIVYSGWNGSAVVPMLLETKLSLGQQVQSEPHQLLVETDWWFSGMADAPEHVSDVIANCLGRIPHVKAVLLGKSGDVYHVWTMITGWSLELRQEVYAVQKELLLILRGFDLDFYVVELRAGARPEDLVSGIPVIFSRAT